MLDSALVAICIVLLAFIIFVIVVVLVVIMHPSTPTTTITRAPTGTGGVATPTRTPISFKKGATRGSFLPMSILDSSVGVVSSIKTSTPDMKQQQQQPILPALNMSRQNSNGFFSLPPPLTKSVVIPTLNIQSIGAAPPSPLNQVISQTASQVNSARTNSSSSSSSSPLVRPRGVRRVSVTLGSGCGALTASSPVLKPQPMSASSLVMSPAFQPPPFIGFVAADTTRWLISGLHFDRHATVWLQTNTAAINMTASIRARSTNVILCEVPTATMRTTLAQDLADVVVCNPDSQSATLKRELNIANDSQQQQQQQPLSRGPMKDVHALSFLPITATRAGTPFTITVLCTAHGLPATQLPATASIELAWMASTDDLDLLTLSQTQLSATTVSQNKKVLGTAPIVVGCAEFPNVQLDTPGEYMFIATAVNVIDPYGDVPSTRSTVLSVL